MTSTPAPDTEREMKLREDVCAICGKTRQQHSTSGGYGVCQIYPIFTSERAMFDRLRPTPLHADDEELVANLRDYASKLMHEPAVSAMRAAADRIQQLSGNR